MVLMNAPPDHTHLAMGKMPWKKPGHVIINGLKKTKRYDEGSWHLNQKKAPRLCRPKTELESQNSRKTEAKDKVNREGEKHVQ